ncbi:hypothetical protein AUJ65_02190 [Candidatus Micrarchaeota archaeon CG1_02_51_15]|nr:MAG: hypothetical protein AUJ65_02190 [Candidatus Micrarchaeota archaeon CG1_02_51_15]
MAWLNYGLARYGLLVAVLMVVALAALVFGPVSAPVADSAYYADIANNLISRGVFESNFSPAYHNPLFPMVIAVFMALFGGAWMKVFSIFSAVALAAAFWFACREFVDERAALLGTLLFAFLPATFYLSLDLLSDALFVAFSLVSLAAYARFYRSGGNSGPSRLALVAWPGFAALAVLTRSTGLVLPIVFLSHIVLEHLRKNVRAPTIGQCSYFIVVFAVIVGVWIGSNVIAGAPAFGGDYASKISSNERYGWLSFSIEDYKVLEGGDAVALNPSLSASAKVPLPFTYALRIISYFALFGTPVLFVLVIWRIYRLMNKPFEIRSLELILLLWLGGFFVFHMVWPLAISFRYVAPMLAVGTILGVGLFSSFFGRRNRLLILLLLLQVVASIAIINWDMSARWSVSRDASSLFQQTGTWLKANTASSDEVLVSGLPLNVVSYYGERKAVDSDLQLANSFVPAYAVISNYSEAANSVNLSSYGACTSFESKQFSVKVLGLQCNGE